MSFVSVTRLRVRSIRFLPQFIWTNNKAVRQLRKQSGFQGGKLLFDRHLTFWTMTLWESEGAMRAYRDAGAHRDAMPKLINWCDEASIFHAQADALPEWDEAHARLVADGRASRVRHPSSGHSERTFPKPRTSLQRVAKRGS